MATTPSTKIALADKEIEAMLLGFPKRVVAYS